MLKCYRDERGFAHADAPPGREILGTFVVQDLQGDLADCKEMLELAEDVVKGRRPEWSGTGNAHAIRMSQSGITIENLWDESLGCFTFSFDEFREAVMDWIAFVTKQ